MLRNKVIFLVVIFILLIIFPKNVFAESQEILDYTYEINIKDDSSISVVETWKIDLKNTNTLYKNFDFLEENFSNVKVVEIIDNKEKAYEQINEYEYHLPNDCFYALTNKDNRFEIAWNCNSNKEKTQKEFKIYYDIKNVTKVYRDCAIFNWNFIPERFNIPIKHMCTKIIFDDNIKDEIELGYTGVDELNVNFFNNNVMYFEIDNCKKIDLLKLIMICPVKFFENSDNYEDRNVLENALQIIRRME